LVLWIFAPRYKKTCRVGAIGVILAQRGLKKNCREAGRRKHSKFIERKIKRSDDFYPIQREAAFGEGFSQPLLVFFRYTRKQQSQVKAPIFLC